MTRPARIVWLAVMLLFAWPQGHRAQEKAAAPPPSVKSLEQIDRELARQSAKALLFPEDRDYFQRAAQTAWRYADRYYRPATGLVAAVPFYDYATVWDLGSSLALLYCGREFGFLDEARYRQRMGLALRTLGGMSLFDRAALNKAYQVTTGAMVDRHQKSSSTGFGWSATDIGRLLVWLRIVSVRDPEFEPAAKKVVARLDRSRLVKDGYLWGEDTAGNGERRVYQEGQLGYEQYAARGFALWNMRAHKALTLADNAIPIDVLGKRVAADERQRDKLTSEPFVLMGIETGWSPEVRALARGILDAQIERARRTGAITIVSEDALNVPPHFFYYYCVFANGRQFSVDVQDRTAVVDRPRWVSTKAAIAWHALMPNAYTRRALQAIEPARGDQGWSSGVYERTKDSTGTLNVNTAAVVMTASLFALRGEPLLAGTDDGENHP